MSHPHSQGGDPAASQPTPTQPVAPTGGTAFEQQQADQANGITPDAPTGAQPSEPTEPTKADMRASFVDGAAALLSITADKLDAAKAWLGERIAVGEDGRPEFRIDAKTIVTTLGEALHAWRDGDQAFPEDLLPPKPEPEPTDHERAVAGGEVLPDAEPRNVIITTEQSQDFGEYERARALAKQRGGQVVVDDSHVEPAPPVRQFDTETDVVLSPAEASDFGTYERAAKLAKARGGRVAVVGQDDPQAREEAYRASRRRARDTVNPWQRSAFIQ